MTDGDGRPAEDHLEWRIDAANSRLVRLVCYAWVGTLGGVTLLGLSGLAVGAAGAAARGEFGQLALLALFVLVGGPLSLLYLLPAIRDADRRPSLSTLVPEPADDPAETTAERYARAFSLRALLVSAVLGALAVPGLAVLDGRLLIAAGLFLFAALVLVAGLTTWGRITFDEPRLEYRTGTVPLEAIGDTRRFDLGGVVVHRISYRPGARTISTPSLLVFTPDAARAFERVLERVEPTDEPPASTNRAVTVVAVAVGALFLAFSIGVVLADAVPLAIGLYLALFTGVLGALFLWAAVALT